MSRCEAFLIATNHHLDKGGEFPRALKRRGLEFEIVDLSKDRPSPTDYKAIISLGSPNTNSPAQVAWYGEVIKAKIPGIGVCVSHQGAGEWLGGKVEPAAHPEIGFVDYQGNPFQHQLTEAGLQDPVLRRASKKGKMGVVWGFHTGAIAVDHSTTIVVAQGADGTVQALRARESDGSGGPFLGVQFHPEVKEEEDLERFMVIYKEVFNLDEHTRKQLWAQHKRYQAMNVGPIIVEGAIDHMLNYQPPTTRLNLN